MEDKKDDKNDKRDPRLPHVEHHAKRKEHAVAAQGAEAVAAAVKEVAEAAVAKVRNTPPDAAEGDFKASGTPGGSLELLAYTGTKFGSSGTVTVAGAQAPTTEWSVDRIFGKMPPDVTEGEVVVHVDEKTKYTSTLNA
ncbi:MAG: hypothetical protein ACHQX3_00265 [Nitrospirales bacterium]